MDTTTLTLFIDMACRALAGALLGTLIGFERQWRGRAAGIRTNALVGLGAALFTAAGALMVPDGAVAGDPSRIAAQVASGIGFLGAGVILKQGASVSGINTAATLWATAAVGTLAGAGLYPLAIVGGVVVALANMALRPLASLLNRRSSASEAHELAGTEYTFEVRCLRADETEIRNLVFDVIHRPGFTVRSISSSDLPDDIVVIAASTLAPERNDEAIEDALASVLTIPEVLGVGWSAKGVESND